jgi:hypothetical protein
MKINFFSTFCCFCILLIASCAKDEGEGGNSTIKGRLIEKTYDNSFQSLLSESVSPDEKVYIIYGGDHETYDDDYNTSYNGEYEFKYLQKGSYTIFAYTVDTTGVAATGYVDENKPKIPVFATVDITDNNSTVNVPDLTILQNNDKGSNSIKGKIFQEEWDGTMTFKYSSYYIPDQDVFIISANGASTYFDDTKTIYNGEYEFGQLPEGSYRVFSYSDDTTGVAANGFVDEHLPHTAIIVDVTVSGNNTVVSVPDISIIDIQ